MGAFISILLDLATTAIIMIFLWCLVMWMFDSSHTENESSPEILPLQSMEDLQERLPIPVQCQEDLDALGSPGTNASVCDREQKFNTGLTESTCKATCGSDDGELQSPTVSHIDDAQYPIQSQEDVDQGVDCIAIHSNADAILDDDSSQIATSAALTNNGGGGAGEFPHETSEGTAAWLKRKPPEVVQIRGRHSLVDHVDHEDDTSQQVNGLMRENQRLRAFRLCRKCRQLPFCFVLVPCGHLLCWQCITRKKCPICDWQISSWYPAILP
ncbi:uncharacterized protein LOC112566608 [Pomacea canaliculata]|uniref:uncharacterized protein LOC112566608 n=1 Tax=Pomacea canaliculata TaxID=400727 RepID=UPI000D73E79D|nr:uncharacterized protein LOC112566608 [Pomacea canaliculata]